MQEKLIINKYKCTYREEIRRVFSYLTRECEKVEKKTSNIGPAEYKGGVCLEMWG